MLLHQFIFGLFLGWGLAIPIGPINLEMIRRNINNGFTNGFSLGLGAISADMTYITILSLGAITILNHPDILKTIGILGAIIIAWFGYKALLSSRNNSNYEVALIQKVPKNSFRSYTEGYLLTLINPFCILFWSSMSMTIAVTSKQSHEIFIVTIIGIILALLSWVFSVNYIVHRTRHYLSHNAMQIMNLIGGIILIAFAVFAFIHAI